MASITSSLIDRSIIKKGDYPPFIKNSIHYETIMGSIAYSVNEDTSDFDVYGVFIPPKTMIFPHLDGYIPGFGKSAPVCNNWQKHHIFDKDAEGGKGRNYDLNFYSIIQYFHLCMDCNPNMIDSLYTDRRCVLYTSSIGEIIRDNRDLFLHKGAWHRFKGYAYQQMHKMQSMNRTGKRAELIEKHGYDVKFAYHIVRLMDEIEQILSDKTLILGRNKEQLKSIRRGEWDKNQIIEFFNTKEKQLEDLYHKSDLQHSPNESKIKDVLLQCLEIAYDDIKSIVKIENQAESVITEIVGLLQKHRII